MSKRITPDDGIDDLCDDPADENKPGQWQEPTSRDGADNADDDVPDNSKTAQAGAPAATRAFAARAEDSGGRMWDMNPAEVLRCHPDHHDRVMRTWRLCAVNAFD